MMKNKSNFYRDLNEFGNRMLMATSVERLYANNGKTLKKPLYDNPNQLPVSELTHVRCIHCENTGWVDLSKRNINHDICPGCYYENGLKPTN